MSSHHYCATTFVNLWKLNTFTSMNFTVLVFFLTFCLFCVHSQENDLIFKSTSANLKGSPHTNSSSTSSQTNKIVVRSQMSAAQCPPELGGRCLCGLGVFAQNRPTFITNCTNAGFGNSNETGQFHSPSYYLQAIDNRTEVLIFTGNHFPELPANLLLLNRSYDQLHTVDLSNNSISTIHGKAFHNMRSVRVLYLNDNRLRITGSTSTVKTKPHVRRINPLSIVTEGRGGDGTVGNSVQDGVDMTFNSEEEEPDEAMNNVQNVDVESPHPRMFSPLRSLEQLHLRNAFDLLPIPMQTYRGKKRGETGELDADAEKENEKASLALVTALGEVFRKSNVSSLKLLNLEANGLTSFESTSSSSFSSTTSSSSFFCALPRLQHLQLAYNRLTGYPVNGSCLRWLSSVDLIGNRIQTMDSHSLALIRSSGPALGALHINLARNPFRCDCALLPFFHFLTAASSETADLRQSPKFEALSEYRCYLHSKSGENDIVGQYIDDLSEADFGDCKLETPSKSEIGGVLQSQQQQQNEKNEAIRRYRHYITLSYIVLVILLLLLAFLLAVLAYTNRAWICSTWNYFLLEMNYPKSDYTALDAKGDNGFSGNGGDSQMEHDIESHLTETENFTESKSNFDSKIVNAVNGNKEKLGGGISNGSHKKATNKGKSGKKFSNRQSTSTNSSRSNHIRMRELKRGIDTNVDEEQV